jgi:hypothetical protein
MSDLRGDVFAISPDIRYVAVAQGQQVHMRSRPDLRNASSSDSDLYEELLVNPPCSPWPPSAATSTAAGCGT